MTTKQILFNTEMVEAILDGIKTQTRRAIQIVSDGYNFNTCSKNVEKIISWTSKDEVPVDAIIKTLSKYKVGDILWVREPARVENWCGKTNKIRYWYQATREDEREIDLPQRFDDIFSGGSRTIIADWITDCKGVPNGCIKEMARIFLKVTNVRVERLQDITLEDIEKEGCPCEFMVFNNEIHDAKIWWINLWNSTAKVGYKWEDNPYVFVYEFERVEK